MKNSNTFGVNFILRMNKEQNGKCPVYARINVNSSRVELSIKTSLAINDWNAGKGTAKPKTPELKKFNSYLEEVRSKLVKSYQELNLGDAQVTAEAVKNAYLGIGPEVKEKIVERTLLWLIKEHNEVMFRVLKKGSMKNYYTTERYIRKFLKEKCKVADINLNDLSYSFMTAFEHFVRTTPIKVNDPCTNNGTMKHLERFKKMTNWAEKNEWINKNPFVRYSLKFKHFEREVLND